MVAHTVPARARLTPVRTRTSGRLRAGRSRGTASALPSGSTGRSTCCRARPGQVVGQVATAQDALQVVRQQQGLRPAGGGVEVHDAALKALVDEVRVRRVAAWARRSARPTPPGDQRVIVRTGGISQRTSGRSLPPGRRRCPARSSATKSTIAAAVPGRADARRLGLHARVGRRQAAAIDAVVRERCPGRADSSARRRGRRSSGPPGAGRSARGSRAGRTAATPGSRTPAPVRGRRSTTRWRRRRCDSRSRRSSARRARSAVRRLASPAWAGADRVGPLDDLAVGGRQRRRRRAVDPGQRHVDPVGLLHAQVGVHAVGKVDHRRKGDVAADRVAAAVVAVLVGGPDLGHEARQVLELAARRANLPPRLVAIPGTDVQDGRRRCSCRCS